MESRTLERECDRNRVFPTVRNVLVVALVAAFAVVPVVPPPSGATIVEGTPVVIETKGNARELRTFTLKHLRRGSARIAASGSAVRVFESSTVDVRGGQKEQHMSGTELLEGALGTLTVGWRGTQSRQAGRRGALIGAWWIVSATGASGQHGQGRFSSDGTFAVTKYLGLLITAV